MNRSLLLPQPACVLLSILSMCGCRERANEDAGQEGLIGHKPAMMQTVAPSEAGMEASYLSAMEEAIIAREYPNIHSVLVAKDGDLVYEKYFEGQDESWGDSLGVVRHHRDSLHDIRSITKSVVSACLGLAVKRGHIKGVGERVFEYFPEYAQYAEGEKSGITLKHLLTMTSGLEWNEEVPYTDPANSEIRMVLSEDPIAFILSRPLITPPGETFSYNGGNTQLLAAILEKTTGMPLQAFAREALFEPLGISDFHWHTFPGSEIAAAASGLRLNSPDLLKFGMLYLHGGRWEGRQLLPRGWTDESLQPYVHFGRNNKVGYGYQFWIFRAATMSRGLDYLIPAAVGNGEQRIYLDREQGLIVVITAGNYNRWDLTKNSEALLTDFIYPSLTGNPPRAAGE